MTDIYLGIAGMVLLGLASFHATRKMATDRPNWLYDVLALLTVLLLLAYIRWCWNAPGLTQILPYSNLIIIGNWFLPLVGVLAGLVWGRFTERTARRWVTIVLLFSVGIYSTLSPVLGQPPKCTDRWEGDLCLQSTDSTCSPAAAATLLRRYGIDATEQEMAELCLTRQGTTWWGLYRGLKLKTAGTAWDVEMIHVDPACHVPRGPVILSVMLEPGSEWTDEYQREWGWIPGVPHSVVYTHQTPDGSFKIVDPFVGIENWSSEDLQVLWRGQSLRLVHRRRYDPVSTLEQLVSLAFGE